MSKQDPLEKTPWQECINFHLTNPFSFTPSMSSPKFLSPYLRRELGVSCGRLEVPWLDVMESLGGSFPSAADNFKFSLGVMPEGRGFSLGEGKGQSPVPAHSHSCCLWVPAPGHCCGPAAGAGGSGSKPELPGVSL